MRPARSSQLSGTLWRGKVFRVDGGGGGGKDEEKNEKNLYSFTPPAGPFLTVRPEPNGPHRERRLPLFGMAIGAAVSIAVGIGLAVRVCTSRISFEIITRRT